MNRKRVDGIRHVTSEESNIFSELGDDADAAASGTSGKKLSS
jgi:hypothetical protein